MDNGYDKCKEVFRELFVANMEAFEAMPAGETHSRHVIVAASLQSHVVSRFSREKREYSGSSPRVRRLYYQY